MDVLFANAGLGGLVPLGKITEASFDLIFGANVKGTVFTVQKGLPLIRDGGSIHHPDGIDDGFDGNAGLQRLHREQGGHPQSSPQLGARPEGHGNPCERPFARRYRNAGLLDGLAKTGNWDAMIAGLIAQTPLGRMSDPDDIAAVAPFLASDDSASMTGSEVFVDGGMAQV